jgi:leucine dehydrogenase
MTVLEQMIERGHERVVFHQDSATGLKAIIAVHSTVLGNALGGTRRWCYATEADALYDVLRLSEGMTYKAACAGLAMGGAKSVIMLPKPGHPSTEAEGRAMGRFVDTLNGTYIAAEDVGVNIQFVDWMALETRHVMGGERVSTGGDPSPFTARGVLNGMRASLAHLGRPVDFDGLTIAIQGVGAVGYYLAELLTTAGAKIKAADINEANVKRVQTLPNVEIVAPGDILTTECDILAPCALGGVIDGGLTSKLRCDIVCGAANNILDDPDEDAVLLRNAGVLYAPDFVVNSGGVIELAGLYLGMTREELDRKNADIEETTAQILDLARSLPSTYQAAITVAKQRIAAGRKEQVHAG